jgi:predicted HTH transcriptional regulator
LLVDRLTDLDATALARLKNTVGESTTLDFKRELPERSHNGSREFLKDLCAFANTHSGDLVFGIVEQNGVAVDVPGIEAADPGAEQERLEQIACSDGIEPRLPRPEFCRIEVGTGRFVFVVRVSQSWTAPHRVSLQGHGHFYARGATTTFAMNVQQLREAFTAAGSRIQRIYASFELSVSARSGATYPFGYYKPIAPLGWRHRWRCCTSFPFNLSHLQA